MSGTIGRARAASQCRSPRSRRRVPLAVPVAVLMVAGLTAAGTLSATAVAADVGTPAPAATAGTVTAKAATTTWKPSMTEDFNSLSSSRWTVLNHVANSNENSYLLARNVSVSGGILRIQGKKESAGGRSYTSGYLQTNGKYAVPNYFRLQVRAKVPFEQGMWAAPMWLRPTDGSGGEMDVVETYGCDRAHPRANETIHTAYGASHQQSVHSTYFDTVGDKAGTGWHVYTIEKVPGSITEYIDGVKSASWSTGNPSWFNSYYEKNRSWNLRVNLQIGGGSDDRPNSSTNWAADKTAMFVDYIHTWTRG